MKCKVMFLLILMQTSIIVFAQKKESQFWIPLKYAENIQAKNLDNINFWIKPIEYIEIKKGVYFIKTYGGNLQRNFSKKVNGKIKIDKFLLNLNYFNLKEQDSINKLEYYIVDNKDSLRVEVFDGKEISSITFIKKMHNYLIENPRESFSKLLFIGEYDVYNFNNEKIESSIQINLKNKIINSKIWNYYEIKKTIIPDIYNELYILLELKKTRGVDNMSFAAKYDEKQNAWVFYTYEINNDGYRITPSLKFSYKFSKKM